jgi:hypothetical protein
MSLAPKSYHTRKARRKAPSVAVYARARGGVEYVCPHCLRFQKSQVLDWRRPFRRCTNRHCNRVIAFGLEIATEPRDVAPWSAQFYPNRASLPVANQVMSQNGVEEALGQTVGQVEFWCPDCSTRNFTCPSPKVGQMICSGCQTPQFVSLLLYTPLPGAHQRTPDDWIPPLEAPK